MTADGLIDPASLFSLEDRVVLVTGASSGLGERFARVLAAAGAQVVATARRADRLEDLALCTRGLVTIPADLSVEADRARLVDATFEQFGRVDILVNNAGIGHKGVALEEPMHQVRQVLEVNVVALYELSQRLALGMIERGTGSIINIASILGLVASAPIPNASYCASKGAVVQLTREMACQWAGSGVRVNAIAPGWFRSEMTADLVANERASGYVEGRCPMGRFGEEQELDGALLFLASNASTYVTGQILAVDGGWTSA